MQLENKFITRLLLEPIVDITAAQTTTANIPIYSINISNHFSPELPMRLIVEKL
jgi:hypothetical protein